MFKIVHNVADWFAMGGIVLLCKIAYYIMLVLTFLQPIAAIVILFAVKLTAGIIIGIIFGMIIVFLINLVLCGLILGYAQFCENCISSQSRSYKAITIASENEKHISNNDNQVFKKPESTSAKISKEELSAINKGYARFLQQYFGSDEKHQPVRIPTNTIVKIIKRNTDATFDIEFNDEKSKKIVTKVQPHYLKVGD